MLVKVLREAGYEEALLGLSLSFYDHKIPLVTWDKLTPNKEIPYYETLSVLESARYEHLESDSNTFWTDEKYTKAQKRADTLAFKGGGHNKFLASMFVWVYIQAPRCWWSEYDTYKVATTANSSSTMHTLSKRIVDTSDFEEGVTDLAITNLNNCLLSYNNIKSGDYHDINKIKLNLPESYLQERQVVVNYMTLQNIIKQRRKHRLSYWKIFCEQILQQLEHSELVYERESNTS